MKIISINVQEPYHSLIIKGEKTVEGRLNKGKFSAVQVGDILELEPEKIKFEIIGKNIYKNFREMLENEGLENVIPDKNNINDAGDIYYKFYTKEQEDKFGVVAIKIKEISS
jgi:ASC-1-like (ASCH) protein